MKLTIRTLFALILIGLIALPAQAAPAAQTGPCLRASSVSIRTGPGGGYLRVGAVSRGECITVLGLSADGNWYETPAGWVWAAPWLWTDAASAPAAPAAPAAPVAPPATSNTPTGAQGVLVSSWLSDPGSPPFSDVVSYVLIYVDGAPRAGIPVTFTWRFTPTAKVCTAVTAADGIAKCVQNVGAAPSGQVVYVQATFRAGARNYSSTTSLIPNGDCDRSYLDFCLERGLPDLDCADIPYRAFTVLAPDPHGFDPDHNGLGCE